MDKAFRKVNNKVDVIRSNQQALKERLTSLEKTQRYLEQSTSFLSYTFDIKEKKTKMDAASKQTEGIYGCIPY